MKQFIGALQLTIFILLPSFTSAEEHQETNLPLRLQIYLDHKNDILFIDRKTNNVLLSNELNKIYSFKKTANGWRAPAQAKNKKWGYLDAKGNWIVKPELDKAKAFSKDNIARVLKKDKWGFINSDGSVLFEPTFNDVTPFQHGLAAIQEKKGGNYYYIDTQGKKAFKQTYCGAKIFSKTGLAAIAVCPTIPVYEVSLDKVEKTISNGKPMWGYINTSGNSVIKPQFPRADTFNSFKISDVTDDAGNSKLINDKGEYIVDTEFKYLWGFSESGVAWGKSTVSDSLTGYIDTKGKLVWKASYHNFNGEHNSLLVNHRNGFQVFNPFGKLIIEERSTWADDFNDAKVTVALRNKRWGILSREGSFKPFAKQIIAPLTNANSFCIGFIDGLIPMINQKREIVFFDREGKQQYQLSANAKGMMSLFDKDQKEIWESHSKQQKIASLLAPGVYEHFSDPKDYGEGILTTVEKLLEAEPKKYFIPNPLFSEGNDPYDLTADIDELKKGSIKIVASTYVSETEWGNYDFLMGFSSRAFDDYEALIKKKISDKYGEPFKSKYSRTQWEIGGKTLTMTSPTDTGDGDFYYQLILEVNKLDKGE